MSKFKIFLPCALESQNFLAEEVKEIINNPENLEINKSGISLNSNLEDIYKLNLYSRIAQRVLILVKQEKYLNENDIYKIIFNINWLEFFSVNKTFRINLTSKNSYLKSLNFATLKVKDAIVDFFRKKTNLRPNIDKENPDIKVQIHLTKDEIFIYLDSSGEGLFKRGYRTQKGQAPLKETLAATMLKAINWNPEIPLIDFCCGSGTILIEAALISSNIPPGINRDFSFKNFKNFDLNLWQKITKEAKENILINPNNDKKNNLIFGSDISNKMIEFSLNNVKNAGIDKMINFKVGNCLELKPPIESSAKTGIILINPPYSERIQIKGFKNNKNNLNSEDNFFNSLGKYLKENYNNWQVWILSSDLNLPKKIHLKAKRRIPLFNGSIECRLFGFDIINNSFSQKN